MKVRLRTLAAVLAVLSLSGAAGWTETPHPLTQGDCPRTQGQRVIELVNDQRVAAGLPPLRVDLRLAGASHLHARDLAGGQESGHTGSDGSDPSRRADRAGYAWTLIGENVAAGQATPEEVVAGWMGSPPHRHNILDPRFTDAGVGFEPEAASRWGTYWVMMFGTTARQDERRPNPCNP